MRLILWGLLFFGICLGNAQTVDLSNLESERNLGPDLDILVDSTGRMDFAAVLAQPQANFRRYSEQVPHLPLTHNTVWVRVRLYSANAQDVYIELANPLTDQITRFEQEADGSVAETHRGVEYPDENRNFVHWNYVFPMSFSAGESRDLIFKIRSADQIKLALRCWPTDKFQQYNHHTMMRIGVFYGVLAGVALLVGLLYVTFRENTYVYYLFTIFSFFLYLTSTNGIALRFLLPQNTGALVPYLATLSLLLLLIALLEFVRKILNTGVNAPRLNRLLGWVATALGLVMILTLVIDIIQVNALLPYLVGAELILLAVTILHCRPSLASGRFYLVGFSFPFFYGCLFLIQRIFPSVPWSLNMEGYYWAFLVMGVFVGYELGRRLCILQKEKVKLQQESVDLLQRIAKIKDEFLVNTSHELKTPLHGIIGIAEGLLENQGSPLPVKAQRSLHLIVSCGRRLSNLLNDILDYSRLRGGVIELHLKPVPLRQIVNMAFSILGPLARKKGLELRNDVSVESVKVLADEERLQQVLINLISNAITFTEKGYVQVSLSIKSGMAEIVVADTGVGISPEAQGQIFEMFHQSEMRGSQLFVGSGIGLCLTRRLVQLHQGKIWVNSSLGSGAQFHFTLPMALAPSTEGNPIVFDPLMRISERANEEEEESSTPEQHSAIRPRILVVDDEPVNLQVLVNQLGLMNVDLSVAGSGTEALELLEREGPPDLVLLDLVMPGMNGFDVCLQIRLQYDSSKLPIIISTAKNQMGDLLKGLDMGANDFLPKPFTRQELFARIRVHLNLSKMHKSLSRFVPSELLAQMRHANLVHVQLGDLLEQHSALLVSDIRNFSSLAERKNPKETFDFLNGYLTRIAPVIRKCGGYISRFHGDAIYALFPGGSNDALDAAMEMRNELDALNATDALGLGEIVRIGIGIHVGKVILGTVGYQSRMEVAVISQRLVEAAELECLTKTYLTDIIISSEAFRLSKESQSQARLLGRIGDLEFLELLGTRARKADPAKVSTRNTFEKGVRYLWENEYDQAILCLEQVLDVNPEDLTCEQLILQANSHGKRRILEGDF